MTPLFELILSHDLEHVCTKFGANPLSQTGVTVLTRVRTSRFCKLLLYLKNSKKIRKICTTPQFELILYYGLEHVCIKYGANPSTQTRVIVLTRVRTSHFSNPYCTEKILEKSEKYVRPPNTNSSFIKG